MVEICTWKKDHPSCGVSLCTDLPPLRKNRKWRISDSESQTPLLRFFLSVGRGGASLYTGYAWSSLASVYKLKDVVYAIFSLMQSIRDS